MIRHLKNKGSKVDLLAPNGFNNSFPDALSRSPQLVDACFTYDPVRVNLFKPLTKVPKRIRKTADTKPKLLEDFCFPALLDKCSKLFVNGPYDAFIVTYVTWAGLAQCAPKGVLKILNIEDIWTFQECRGPDGVCREFGAMIEDEITRMQSYDYIISISRQESELLRHFMPAEKLIHAPVFFEDNYSVPSGPTYHAVFVGSDNPHNILGIRWFYDQVEPLIHPDLKIAVVGKICDAVESRSARVRCLGPLQDLGGTYRTSAVALSCLFTGTGQKIKVVEALSYGLPVVATTAGLRRIDAGEADGCFLSDTPEGFAGYITTLNLDEELRADAGRRAHHCFLRNYTEEVACKELVLCPSNN